MHNRKITDIRKYQQQPLHNLMDTEALLSQLNINQLTDNIFNTRRITRRDQRLLMYLLSSYRLGEQEQNLINRIYEMLNKGLLRVVD